MLFVISPAKTLDLESAVLDISTTQPRLLKESEELVSALRNYSISKLCQLMDVSDKIAALNVARFQEFSVPFTRNNSRPSLWCFKGDVYKPLDISQYFKKEVVYAQEHVRILSGLYGVLRPTDLMQPYRLEMGTKLKVKKAKDLYNFWGNKITGVLNEDLAGQKDRVLVNLASEEYFRAVRPEGLKGRVLNVVFKEAHKGKLKIIAIHAKKARGMMVNFAILNKVNILDDLKKFKEGGYGFSAKLSNEENWVFTR